MPRSFVLPPKASEQLRRTHAAVDDLQAEAVSSEDAQKGIARLAPEMMSFLWKAADIPAVGLLSLLRRHCARLSHAEALSFGRRIGRICFGFYRFGVFPAGADPVNRLIGKAFGPDMAPGQRREASRQCFEHMGMLVTETLNSRKWPPERYEEIVRIEGLEHAERAYNMDKGLIVLTAHYGNWEVMAGAPSILFGKDAHVLMREQPLPRLNEFLKAARGRHIKYLHSIKGGTGVGTGGAAGILREGGILIVLNDQHFPGQRTETVPFFGKSARTPSAVAYLSHVTGAPLLPVFASRERGRSTHHVIRFHSPAIPKSSLGMKNDIIHLLGEYRRVLEEEIRRDPAQYIWTFDPWT